ncbi:hypothetical protein Peur_023339 [Populus x canadensis]
MSVECGAESFNILREYKNCDLNECIKSASQCFPGLPSLDYFSLLFLILPESLFRFKLICTGLVVQGPVQNHQTTPYIDMDIFHLLNSHAYFPPLQALFSFCHLESSYHHASGLLLRQKTIFHSIRLNLRSSISFLQ